MPRTTQANEEIRARRRADILGAAAHVFARKGFAGTKIPDLARASGMSQGLLYRYFASKDEVFTEVVRAAMACSTEYAEQARTQPGTPWERLRWFVENFLPLQYDHPEYPMVVAHALSSEAVPPGVREEALCQLDALGQILRELIVDGQRAGEIILRDPDQLTIHLLTTLHGLAVTTDFYRERALRFPAPEILLLALRPEPATTFDGEA